MATYKSEKVEINQSAEAIYERLSNPENLRDIIEQAPEGALTDEQRAQLDSIQLTPDSISVAAGPVGALTLRAKGNKPPQLIRFEGENTPVPMSLEMHIAPLGEEMCEAQVIINLEIPMMLKPMVNGPLQKMVDQFGTLLRHLRV